MMKRFYDPHPGFAGAAIPLPGPVKEVVDRLAGRELVLEDALAEICAVTKGEVKVEKGWISLRLGSPGGVGHVFRLIRFEDRLTV